MFLNWQVNFRNIGMRRQFYIFRHFLHIIHSKLCIKYRYLFRCKNHLTSLKIWKSPLSFSCYPKFVWICVRRLFISCEPFRNSFTTQKKQLSIRSLWDLRVSPKGSHQHLEIFAQSLLFERRWGVKCSFHAPLSVVVTDVCSFLKIWNPWHT